MIIPKLIGVEEYGYWQLYIFYSSYVGFLHFGWNDGIYLRLGGEEYEKLDRPLFHSQFIQLLVSQLLIAGLIGAISLTFADDANRAFILQMVALTMVISNTRFMLLFILQATNRIKEYARITIVDRILYIAFIVVLLLAGARSFRVMILADIVAKFATLIWATYLCKEIVWQKLSSFRPSLKETAININVGIKLMFANIASMLIIGIVRFAIERVWDVATFGKISLTLSLSNMMMIFINAVGIIMFPILRRTKSDKLPGIYITMRDFLMTILLGILIVYYPLRYVMSMWLPQYADSLAYMAVVFPMFIYEGKMALLINTYMKTLRKEKTMLAINLVSMLLSLLLTVLATVVWRSLDLAIVNIVIVLAVRSLLAEVYLARELNIRVVKDIALEILLTAVFILSGWFIDSWLTMLVYGLAYIVYLVVKRKDIATTIRSVQVMLKA